MVCLRFVTTDCTSSVLVGMVEGIEIVAVTRDVTEGRTPSLQHLVEAFWCRCISRESEIHANDSNSLVRFHDSRSLFSNREQSESVSVRDNCEGNWVRAIE